MAGNKSVLMTPDPFHTPGYGGFCPQFKYQIGETFGRTTSHLLRNSNVASSGRLVLGEIHPSTTEADRLRDMRSHLMRTRTQSWGDQKLVECMVPGYTGFVPKNQHYFGKRYAENCMNAASDFENDQRKHNQKIQDLRTIEAIQSGRVVPKEGQNLPQISTRHKTPLVPIAKEPRPYISRSSPPHTMSPYYMGNDNSEKLFMSGYTGFVPRSRGMLGMGYPLITHAALNEFTDNLKKNKTISTHPIMVHREESRPVNTTQVYPVESGLVPHYTGHIPGEKFRYGNTFGHSTENALRHPSRALTA